MNINIKLVETQRVCTINQFSLCWCEVVVIMASSSNRQGLTSDPTHLMKSYGVYVKRLAAHKETVKWIQEKLPDVLKQALSNDQVL